MCSYRNKYLCIGGCNVDRVVIPVLGRQRLSGFWGPEASLVFVASSRSGLHSEISVTSKTRRTASRVPQSGKQAKPRSTGVDGVGTVLTEPPLL